MKALLAGIGMMFCATVAAGQGPGNSADTEACLECHATLHPGIVAEWRKSRHAVATPAAAIQKPALERRVSAGQVSEKAARHSVGCAECHTMNADIHADTFEHNGYAVHTVVTPKDCAACHPTEATQYEENLMSQAHGNLVGNTLYVDMMNQINGSADFVEGKLKLGAPDAVTDADSCLFCHGTRVEVKGKRTVASDFGDVEVPVLAGWPNQGVGRINPDGTKGACSACHTRHQFSIVMARKPDACAECHKGPDVPAYPVFSVSKHGGIYAAMQSDWDFGAVPWVPGKDFSAPTCAACHVSLLVNSDGELLVERTHRMNDRLPWRIFGLIYAHPHPKSADTTPIRNAAGLPLPTELTGEAVSAFLISDKERAQRLQTMQKGCLACHARGWVDGHFDRFSQSLKVTNRMTLAATKVLLSAWEQGAARGPALKDSLFNEGIERMWVEQWLFYSNSVRFASAMAGADYGVFANGRWYLSKNLQDMVERLKLAPKASRQP